MSVSIKTAREIELMRHAGHLLEQVHDELAKMIRPGISTLDIDRAGEKMIREMGKNVTVEGVETENMAKELKQMNVNDLQGYYFAKPLPPEAFLSYLKTSS